eukprot:TRINITY_DN1705_c0_g1_i1.p2 TRINITY_DN1705_c0_g1~~TRINITY_DN1705_c0_g1_i1.p2  ORF type:complete len:207 (+),score=52.12 TRINITY_DN1705_c0_g1_i1:116-736(+)
MGSSESVEAVLEGNDLRRAGAYQGSATSSRRRHFILAFTGKEHAILQIWYQDPLSTVTNPPPFPPLSPAEEPPVPEEGPWYDSFKEYYVRVDVSQSATGPVATLVSLLERIDSAMVCRESVPEEKTYIMPAHINDRQWDRSYEQRVVARIVQRTTHKIVFEDLRRDESGFEPANTVNVKKVEELEKEGELDWVQTRVASATRALQA